MSTPAPQMLPKVVRSRTAEGPRIYKGTTSEGIHIAFTEGVAHATGSSVPDFVVASEDVDADECASLITDVQKALSSMSAFFCGTEGIRVTTSDHDVWMGPTIPRKTQAFISRNRPICSHSKFPIGKREGTRRSSVINVSGPRITRFQLVLRKENANDDSLVGKQPRDVPTLYRLPKKPSGFHINNGVTSFNMFRF